MNKIIILLVSISLLVGCTDAKTGNSSIETDIKVSKSIKLSPEWTLTDFEGTTHNFPASAKGKTTVILFWATWCPYCKRLMPHLQSILYQYAEELDLQIYALDIFDKDGDPVAYLEENGYDFLLFKNAEELAKLYGIQGTPGVLIIDGQGQIQFDLRTVQTGHLKAPGSKHWQKAIKTAPYWASEIRKALDLIK